MVIAGTDSVTLFYKSVIRETFIIKRATFAVLRYQNAIEMFSFDCFSVCRMISHTDICIITDLLYILSFTLLILLSSRHANKCH